MLPTASVGIVKPRANRPQTAGLSITTLPGFDRSVQINVTASDGLLSNMESFTFAVTATAPTVAPIGNVSINHNAPAPTTVPTRVTDPNPDAAMRTYSVAVSGYNPSANALPPASPTVASNRGPLYDAQTLLGLTIPVNPATINATRNVRRRHLLPAAAAAVDRGKPAMHVPFAAERQALRPRTAAPVATTVANDARCSFSAAQPRRQTTLWAGSLAFADRCPAGFEQRPGLQRSPGVRSAATCRPG